MGAQRELDKLSATVARAAWLSAVGRLDAAGALDEVRDAIMDVVDLVAGTDYEVALIRALSALEMNDGTS